MTIHLKALLLAAVCLPTTIAVTAAETVSLEPLLNEMVDAESIARWPAQDFACKQASSYERAKIAPDKPGWFANNDHTQYIRSEDNEGRQELVMMEADGPGAIVRSWLTAGGDKQGVIRVYLDGVQPTAPLRLGGLTPVKGKFILRAEVTGANPASKGAGYFFGLDGVSLEKP